MHEHLLRDEKKNFSFTLQDSLVNQIALYLI